MLQGKEAASGTATQRTSVPSCSQSSHDMPFLLPTLPAQPSPALAEEAQQSEKGGRRREGQGGEATLSHLPQASFLGRRSRLEAQGTSGGQEINALIFYWTGLLKIPFKKSINTQV